MSATCYVIDYQVHATKLSKWRRKARDEFWRASYAPLPASLENDAEKLFQPRMDFATTLPSTPIESPWKEIDFKTEPKAYLESLLEKCLDSNVEVDFDMTEKKEKPW